MISLRKLFQQKFEDHKGRPGKRGGSLPKGGGSSKATDSKDNPPSKEISLTKKGFRAYDKRGNDLGGKSTTYFKGKIFEGDGIVVHRDGSNAVKEVDIISGYQRLGKPYKSIDEAYKQFTIKQPGY